MSIEKLISELTAAILDNAAALRENTEVSAKYLEARTGETAAKNAPGKTKTEDAEPEKTETPEKTKKPAAKKPAAKPKPAAETEEDFEEDFEEDEADAEPVTLTEVKKAAIDLRDSAGVDALEVAKKAFKIDKVKDIPEKDYAAFVRHCKKLAADADEV